MKQKHNDAMKRAVGVCQNRDCRKDGPTRGVVKEGFEMCFDWSHRDQATKARDKNGKTISIGNMCSDAMRDDDWKAKLEHEISFCDLECRDCHHEFTHRKRSLDGDFFPKIWVVVI